MCASAYCVLPLQGNFEGLANPGRLHGGVSVPSIAPGSRPHRTSQETEMDLTWQELMAITELQEFEASDETNTYYPIEPTVGVAGFGVTQPPTEPLLPDCGITSTYEGPYNEALHTCQHLGTNPQALYGRSGAQLPARLHPNQHSLQSPPLTNLLEHTGLTGASEGISTDSVGNAQGCPMPQLGPVPRKQATPDDLESDSGLSLGSSPPLTSPGNMATGATAYQGLEVGQCYGDGEPSEIGNMPESCRVRADLFYPMDYQHPINTYSATTSTYFPPPANLSLIHQQPRPQQPALLKPHILPPNLHDLHLNGSVMPVNKAGSFQGTYGKPKGPGTQGGSVRGSAPLSRDERRALVLKIPFPLDKIVNLPVDDFNELLTQHTLSDAQLTLVRDIRRRGKNKVAAQNCRKRKLENIVHLEGELGQLQAQRDHLVREGAEFHHKLALARQHLSDLYTVVFSQLRDEEGQPYSLDHYSLHQGNDGNIFLVSRNAAEYRE